MYLFAIFLFPIRLPHPTPFRGPSVAHPDPPHPQASVQAAPALFVEARVWAAAPQKDVDIAVIHTRKGNVDTIYN